MLAFQIKKVLDEATLSLEALGDLRELKSELPLIVRSIVWGDKVALYNKKHNEYLYAYYDAMVYSDGSRRPVYTWRPGGSAEKEGFWKFDSTDGGKTFSIKNTNFNEYLYAAVSKYDSNLRNTATWKPPCPDKVCFWQIEFLGDNEIRIFNAEHLEEKLVAAGDSYAHDKDRRNVFTGKASSDEHVWRVELVK